MDEKLFHEYLKKSGRKQSVIERYSEYVGMYEDFLGEEIEMASSTKVINFVSDYENKTKKSARTILYALMHYFKAMKNESMYKVALELRNPRKVKKTPFQLKKILDINSEYIKKLNDLGIKNVNDMIKAGKTPELRNSLASKSGIPRETILELVKISDLARIGYVKEKLSRLYYNAGVETPQHLSKWSAEALHKHFEEYIKRTKWDGMIPFLSDLKNNIASAKKLKSVVIYE